MKKLSFLMVLMLIDTPIFANQKSYTIAQAQNILGAPEKFVQTCKQSRKSENLRNRFIKPEHIARKLLDIVKNDQQFLRQVYTLYIKPTITYKGTWSDDSAQSIISQSFIVVNAIRRMNANDDTYFKKLFEGTTDYHIRKTSLLKINDFIYVKKVIANDAKDEATSSNPGAQFLLMRGEELYKADPHFVDLLADNAINVYVREYAIGATSNRTILMKYANLTDINQYNHPSFSKAATDAFNNDSFQRAAARKLARLQKK